MIRALTTLLGLACAAALLLLVPDTGSAEGGGLWKRAALLAAIVPLSFVCMALSNRERLAQRGVFEGPAQLPGGIETARGGIRPSR